MKVKQCYEGSGKERGPKALAYWDYLYYPAQ